MKRKIYLAIIIMVMLFLIPAKTSYAGNGIPFCQVGEVTDEIVDVNTNIEYSLYVPQNVGKCNDLIFAFHGWGASEDDYNGIPLYYELKQHLYNPNAYICFISKDKGSWPDNIEKTDLTSFINNVVKMTGVKRVHYVGYSQGTYDAVYLSSCYNKWTNALLIDGGDFSTKLSKTFTYSIWIAGYDKKSYLSLENQQYVSEYYEPMCEEIFTSSYKYHYKSAVFGLTNEKTSKYFDDTVSEYYDYPCIDGIEILISK